MKKTLIACLLLRLIYAPDLISAFELPAILERNLADDILQWGTHFKNRTTQEGTINTFINFNSHKATLGFLQIGSPLHDKMVGKYHLLRLEVNLLESLNFLNPSHFEIAKVGFSGRHIIKPNLILGWYLLHDWIPKLESSDELPGLFNVGLEAIWPRSVTVIVDSVFHPQNLMSDNRAGQISIKGGILKPQKLDLFMAVSGTKYLDSPLKWTWTFVGIKRPVPIHKWNIHKHWTAGASLTYKKADSWINTKNFGWSVYLQGSWLKPVRQNSLRDYLRMPIDRFVAAPYHPGHYPTNDD